MSQPGFFDLDERYAKLNERDPLVKLNQIIDWEAFREPLPVLRNKPRKSQAGRKPYDVVCRRRHVSIHAPTKEATTTA